MFQALFRLLCVSRLKNRVRFWFSCFILITCCFSFIPLYFIGKAHLEGEVVLQLQQTTDLEYTFIEQWLEKRASNIHNLANLSYLFSIALGMIGIIFLSIWISFYIALQLPRRLEEGEERFRLLAEHSSDMITIHDMNGVYQYVSPASRRLLGYHHEELLGKVPYDFMHPDDRKSTREKLINLLNTDYELTTFRIRAKDGHYVWFETTLKSIKDQEGKIQEVIAVSRNITDRKKMELELKQSNEHLQYLSSIDSVTGIANRRYFKENFEQEWKRAIQESTPISIILLDIDCFKAYNDTYGHQSGDHSLKQVSKTLESTLHGSHDLVARYGGEEFIIVLPDTDRNEAFIKAEELRSNVEALQIPHETSPIGHYVTISVGVSTMTPSFHQSADILIKEADKALYAAKSEGRNQVKAGDNL